MAVTVYAHLVFLAAGLSLLAVGLWLVWRGRPQRYGAEPHCRKCDYSLVGIAQGGRCPECGARLAGRGTRYGERRRRAGLWWGGWALSLAGLMALSPVGWRMLAQVDWYQYKPTFLVMRDLRSTTPATAQQAWRELQRREAAGGLGAGRLNELAELGLAEQAGPARGPVAKELIDFLGRRCLSGGLTQEQQQRFLKQMVAMELRVRARVARGDPVVYEVSDRGYGPATGGATVSPSDGRRELAWWVQVSLGHPRVDASALRTGVRSRSMGAAWGGGHTSTTRMAAAEPGRHKLAVPVQIEVFHGRLEAGEAGLARLWSEERVLTGEFEVLADAPADWIRHTTDPGLGEVVRASVTPVRFEYETAGEKYTLRGNIRFRGAPADLALAAYARIGGREYRMNAVTCRKGGSLDSEVNVASLDGAPPAQIEVILRSSDQAARETVDMTEIWAGELVYREVGVGRSPWETSSGSNP